MVFVNSDQIKKNRITLNTMIQICPNLFQHRLKGYNIQLIKNMI